METLAEAFGRIMAAQDGVEEDPRGSNTGPMVNQYLAAVHLPPGNAWCAALVSWAVLEAVKAVGGPEQFVGSGSALGLLHANPHLVITAFTGEPCVGVLEHADHIHGHAFAILGLNSDGHYITFEGNTNDDGGREGYRAMFRTRDPKTLKGLLMVR